MRYSVARGVGVALGTVGVAFALVGCTPANDPDVGQGGTVAATLGGASATGQGGATATQQGGATPGSGGHSVTGTGGATVVHSGGATVMGTGGSVATGGSLASSGGATAVHSGGTTVTGNGGTVATGGTAAANGGTTVTSGGTVATGGIAGTGGRTAQPPVLEYNCNTDADCCVATYTCMAEAWLVTKSQKSTLEAYLATLPTGMCVACIQPVVDVRCVAGYCSGTKLPYSEANRTYSGAHCGRLPLGAAGAAGAGTKVTASFLIAVTSGGTGGVAAGVAAGVAGTSSSVPLVATGGSPSTRWNCGS